MSDQDIFAGSDPIQPQFSLEDVLGEDKKYKTEEDVARALYEKDRFIERLKREAAEARDALSKRITEEDFLDGLERTRQAEPRSAEPQNPQVQQGDEHKAAPLTAEDVDRIVAQREAANRRQQNLNTVLARLQEVYGDEFRSRVQSHAKELGVGTDFLQTVAAENPNAFYQLLGLNQSQSGSQVNVAPPRSTSAPAPTGANATRKDYSYYKKLRDEKGDMWYFSLPVQQEIWEAAKAAEARGERFLPD